MNDDELLAAVEALIFASDEPVTLTELSGILNQPKAEIKRVIDLLVEDCDRKSRGLRISEVAGGYRMTTKPEQGQAVALLKNKARSRKLTFASLETLAIVAYKQPVTAPEIFEIRGVNTSGVLKTLLERKLIKITGRKNVVGRPLLYGTTKEFLIQFGMNDLSELPKIEEFEEVTGEDPGKLSLLGTRLSESSSEKREEEGTVSPESSDKNGT
jgi:segregation and condensation protein B